MDELGDVFEDVSRYFALLAEPMRVRVLHALCQGEKTVSEVVAATGGSQTNVSRHLGALFRAGALTRRKQGNFVHYDVGDRALAEICRTVCVHVAARCAEVNLTARPALAAIARDFDPAIGRTGRSGERAVPGGIGSANSGGAN